MNLTNMGSWSVARCYLGVGRFLLTRAVVAADPPSRQMSRVKTRIRAPRSFWQQKTSTKDSEYLTGDNERFVREMVDQSCSPGLSPQGRTNIDPETPFYTDEAWTPRTIRCGLIARKIGVVPMWLKTGKYITATMLHVSDNHVVRSLTPEEMFRSPAIRYRYKNNFKELAGVVVGADQDDPRKFTKIYSNLFSAAGLLPTHRMARFVVSPSVVMAPGSPLRATHFEVGDFIDICGRTIERGFQGVMKRWGFSGMPATHGTCKTHRRPGCIGSGAAKARVWPGQKMPGHMGGDRITSRGNRILRINTRYDVIYVQGTNVPGETGNYVLLHDSILPLRRRKKAPKIWTSDELDNLADDLYHPDVHRMCDPTISFST